MAANQISNQRSKSGSTHKATQPGRRPSPTTDDSHSDFGSMAAERASDYLAKGASQVRELTHNREGAAVAVALAAGLGVGLVIGAALVRSRREQRSWRDRVTAEGFGRRLMDRIEGLIPDALAEHFGK